jgi:hypothetical protein
MCVELMIHRCSIERAAHSDSLAQLACEQELFEELARVAIERDVVRTVTHHHCPDRRWHDPRHAEQAFFEDADRTEKRSIKATVRRARRDWWKAMLLRLFL